LEKNRKTATALLGTSPLIGAKVVGGGGGQLPSWNFFRPSPGPSLPSLEIGSTVIICSLEFEQIIAKMLRI